MRGIIHTSLTCSSAKRQLTPGARPEQFVARAQLNAAYDEVEGEDGECGGGGEGGGGGGGDEDAGGAYSCSSPGKLRASPGAGKDDVTPC